MNRNTFLAIAVASALLAPAVVEAAGRIEPTKPVVVAEVAIAATRATELAGAPVVDGCTRRVRVVYAAAYQMPTGDCPAASSTK